MINNCLNIENNIKYIKEMNINIQKYKSNSNKEIQFYPRENHLNEFIEKIKNFGDICSDYLEFKWKKGTNYTLTNNDLIATKTNGGNNYNCNILGDIVLPKNKINKWKIKLKTYLNPSGHNWDILIGVGPSNLNQSEYNLYNKTWTFICGYSMISIQSGSTTDYNGNKGKLKQDDIVEVIMNTIKGELSFSINDVDYGIACKIPSNMELSPFVSIYDQGESIELLNN